MNKILVVVYCHWKSADSNLPTEVKLPIAIPPDEDILEYLNDVNPGELVENFFHEEMYDCTWEYVIPYEVLSELC